MASDVSDGVDDGMASSDEDQRIDAESESDRSNVVRWAETSRTLN